MPNEFIARNGVIALANSTVSGSLSVTNSVSGSIFTGSFIGNLTGTASYSNLALTASYVSGASSISASYALTSSFASTSSFAFTASFVASVVSSSYALTASFAMNGGSGGGTVLGATAQLTQTTPATTWSFAHNLGLTYPIITVYDSASNAVIQPLNIIPSGSNNINIFFSTARAGYATAVAGGGYYVTNTGTTRKLTQTVPAATWSFVHNIGDQFPAIEVYDNNNNVIIPSNIQAVDANTSTITFAYSASGTAVATLGGGINNNSGTVITIPSASATWSLNHNLGENYPIVTLWESGSRLIIQPDNIRSVDMNSVIVTFTQPIQGFANVTRAGSIVSGSTLWSNIIGGPFTTVGNNTSFTGSLTVTGSLNISGSGTLNNVGPANFTGSVLVTGSLAVVTAAGNEFQVNPTGINLGNALTDSHVISGSLRVNPNGLFVSSSGLVGIGTTNPSQLFEVVGGEIKAGRVDSSNEGGQVSFGRSTDNATAWYIDAYANVASPQLRFVNVTNAVVAMTITGSNVGIGTSSPSNFDGVAFTGPFFDVAGIMQIKGTSANTIAALQFGGSTYRKALIYSTIGTETPALVFAVASNGSNSSANEAMRITSGGAVCIGTTSTIVGANTILHVNSSDAGPTFKNANSAQQGLELWSAVSSGDNLFIEFSVNTSISAKGSIDYNRGSNATRYNTSSDVNLKNIIGESDKQKSIDILNSTKIKEFSWKEDETNKVQIGVIAQELYETYKGAVSVGSDESLLGTEDYKSWKVDKTAFTFHLIAGWQKHEQLIQELKAENDSLKSRIETLESK
jgi:hypothetical protein